MPDPVDRDATPPHPLDCECDTCNEAAHNLPCTGCDCCASGDCKARFCSDCPCTAGRKTTPCLCTQHHVRDGDPCTCDCPAHAVLRSDQAGRETPRSTTEETAVEQSAKYQPVKISVSLTGSGFRSQNVIFDCCNLCGALVGNKPAHDVFCYSDDR